MENEELVCIGRVVSELKTLADCPKQGVEGAPSAHIEIDPRFRSAMKDIRVGNRLILLTWFHLADRKILEVHPRHDKNRPLTGVFSTRSPHRPNPIGLHEVAVLSVGDAGFEVAPLEALDGTPVVDVKIGTRP